MRIGTLRLAGRSLAIRSNSSTDVTASPAILVIMSPLLSNKINNLEKKVENIDIKLDKILNILSGL